MPRCFSIGTMRFERVVDLFAGADTITVLVEVAVRPYIFKLSEPAILFVFARLVREFLR
jgi:hypothetical protein